MTIHDPSRPSPPRPPWAHARVTVQVLDDGSGAGYTIELRHLRLTQAQLAGLLQLRHRPASDPQHLEATDTIPATVILADTVTASMHLYNVQLLLGDNEDGYEALYTVRVDSDAPPLPDLSRHSQPVRDDDVFGLAPRNFEYQPSKAWGAR